MGIWTFCPAQEQTDETAVVQKAAAATEEYYSGSDRYTSSPQTWSEMKFGGATPNLYTGTVSVSVPVYTYEDPDFTIPVSLSYGSNGYTPNVPANYVGLGWSLHAGGQIVQEVRGISDFGHTLYISGYSFFEEKDFAGKTVELNVNDIRKMPICIGSSTGQNRRKQNRIFSRSILWGTAENSCSPGKRSMFSIRTIRRENIR